MGGCFSGGKGGKNQNFGFVGPSAGNKTLIEMSKKDLSSWKNGHVRKWYELQQFPNSKTYEKVFLKMNGKDLDKLTKQNLVENFKILNRNDRNVIFSSIQDIQEKRHFHYAEHIVFKKIEKMTKNARNTSWKYLVETLSNPVSIRETYLNPSMVSDALDQYLPFPDSREEVRDKYERLVDPNIVDNVNIDLKRMPKNKMRLPVKLVITEINDIKNAKTLLRPVFNRIPQLSPRFGKFHTAIIVGPWWLEWSSSSLCVPRKLYSDMALVSADLDTTTILKGMGIDSIIDRLSNVIAKWNTTMSYSSKGSTGQHQGNCQHFVEDVMDSLGIKCNRQGAFYKYFERIKNRGRCEMIFEMSKKFQRSFRLKMSTVQFDTHADLDNFVQSCMNVDEISFEMDFKEEYQLLKSFDRAFWLRHFKKPSLKDFKGVDCPFDDPRETKSFITYT